jgi:glycosyltransferase involved in cell wall biosynthesis
MKIAQIASPWIPVPPDTYDGTENVIYNLVEQQVALGHNVTLFAPGDARTSAHLVSFFSPSLRLAGVPWQSHLKAYYHLHKAVTYIKDHAYDFDVVHTHLSSTADMYLFPLTHALPLPHVMTLHSQFPFDRVHGIESDRVGDADAFFLEWASSVHFVALSQAASEAIPYDLNFAGVVHNGLSPAQFQPTVEQPEDFFTWIGKFSRNKSPHLAIEAANVANVPIKLAGIIDEDRPDSISYFENMIKPQIDQQQVQYIGPVNMQQKIDLLSRAKGYLNPLAWEGPFGMSMIEAMAVGCPVIAFARGSAPEIVTDQKTGFIVQDVPEMAGAIARISQLDRAAIRQHARDRFSSRAMAEKYLNLYQKIITARDFDKPKS